MLSKNLLGPQGSLVDPLGFGSLRLRFKSGWSHFVSTRLSSIWQSVGLQIQMLLVQVRQAGFFITLFEFCLYFLQCSLFFKTFIYNEIHILLIVYSLDMHDNLSALPWWCRGYHVGLSSPRLGFKSRPGRLNS